MAWDALQDPCLIFLCFAAAVSFLVGIIFQQGMEWLEVRTDCNVLFQLICILTMVIAGCRDPMCRRRSCHCFCCQRLPKREAVPRAQRSQGRCAGMSYHASAKANVLDWEAEDTVSAPYLGCLCSLVRPC
jgi:hypothetical protein